MDFLDSALAAYAEAHTSPEPKVLAELNRETNLKVLMPRMLSGHLQGRLLSMLSQMIKPKRILEIGTYTGYSAICLSSGLAEGGEMITIDVNAELEPIVKRYFKDAGVESKIKFMVGNAVEIIPTLPAPFDLVFIDADKNNYSNYYDLVFPKLNPGGYIIADNVLWSGNVLKEKKDMDEDTLGIIAFNEKVQQDNRVENVLLPVRDGLMVVRKLNDN